MNMHSLSWSSLWRHLSSLGADQENFQLRKRIILTNKFSLTLFIFAFVYGLAWFFTGSYVEALFNIVCALIFVSVPFLNGKGYVRFTRFLVLVSINLAVFLLVGAIGKAGDSQICFYVLAGLAFLLFEPREKINIVIAILIPMVLFGYLSYYDFKLFDFPVPKNFVSNPIMTQYSNFIFIILCMFYLYRETEKVESELKLTNAKLQNSQIFLKSIIENIPLVFYTRDLDNRYTLVNSEFEKAFGVKSNDLLYKTDSEIFPKSTVDFLVLHDQEVLKTNSSKNFEATISAKGDQKERTYLCTKFPILGPSGDPFGVCGIATDISDRIEAQKRLDEQRALVLNNIRLSALGEMANGMSHEINNPLATVTLIQGKLLRLLSSGAIEPTVLKDSLLKIRDNVHRVSDIIAALRKFIGDSTSSYETIHLNDLIKDTLELCREKFKQAGIELNVDSHGTPTPLVLHSEGIRQVIYNLLTNAYDAVENNKGGFVHLTTDYGPGAVKISVSDSGPGVPSDLENKLFQPFFTTKDIGRGQGLGLSISRGIVSSHGGKLYLDSNKKLTTFVIELPNEAHLKI